MPEVFPYLFTCTFGLCGALIIQARHWLVLHAAGNLRRYRTPKFYVAAILIVVCSAWVSGIPSLMDIPGGLRAVLAFFIGSAPMPVLSAIAKIFYRVDISANENLPYGPGEKHQASARPTSISSFLRGA